MTNCELRGVIHGRTIVLDEELGLPDGATVAVLVSELPAPDRRVHGLALGADVSHAAGPCKDDDEEGLDEYLRSWREQRPVDAPEIGTWTA